MSYQTPRPGETPQQAAERVLRVYHSLVPLVSERLDGNRAEALYVLAMLLGTAVARSSVDGHLVENIRRACDMVRGEALRAHERRVREEFAAECNKAGGKP